MELWSGTLSVFSAKVRIAAAEKGVPLQIRELTWTRAAGWGEKPAGLLAVSPRGEVPVLVDGDLAVFDSTVINEYLEDCCPEQALLPADPRDRARCRMWEELADDVLARTLPVLVSEVYLKPGGEGRDEAAVAVARATVQGHYQRLNDALADAGYLCGAFSLADIANFLAVAFCQSMGAGIGEGHVALGAWFQRVLQRPAVKAEFDAILAASAAA